MTSDPVEKELLADLKRIRRGAGPLTVDRLAEAEAVIEFLGRGSIENAYGSLLNLRDVHGQEAAGDIATYFFSAGDGVGGDTLDWRLNRYAEQQFVDQRTALRRSDRGARKLAQLIRESLVNERPWGIVVVRQIGETVRASVRLAVPNGSLVRQPHIYVNGERLRDIYFDFEDNDISPILLSSVRDLPTTPLCQDPDGVLYRLTIYWMIRVWPTWTLGAHVNNSELHAKMEVGRAGQIGVELIGI